MRARESVKQTWVGQAHRGESEGISDRALGLSGERRRSLAIQKDRSGSYTTRERYENEERGCAKVDSEGMLKRATNSRLLSVSERH